MARRMHLTPFVAVEMAPAVRAVISGADADVVALVDRGMRPRRPGTPRWGVMNAALPWGEEAWMNAEAEFEEAIREKDAARCRAMMADEARKDVMDAVEKALSSCHGMMRFRRSHWIFWTREEPFSITRTQDGDLKVKFGDDSITVNYYGSYGGWFVVSSMSESLNERVSMNAGASAAAKEIARHVIRALARTAIPTTTKDRA